MKPPRVVVFALALIFSLTASAADKRPITPQDLWAFKRVGSPALSPDGRTVVFSVQEWSVENNRSSTNLWVVEAAGGAAPRRLTTARAADSSPTWSPDGSRLAFISKRADDEVGSLYVMRIDGGEPEKILELPFGVSNPKWMPDGKGIVVATTVIPELAGAMTKADLTAMKKEVRRRRDSKITAKATEDRQYRYFDHYLTDNLASRLLLVNGETKEFKDLTPTSRQLFSNSGDVGYDIAPDGRSIALVMNSTPPPFREENNADIYLVPTDGSGALRNLTADNKGNDGSPVFAPDGKSLLYARTETTIHNGESSRLWRHDFGAGKNTLLTKALDYSFAEFAFDADGKTLWLTAEEKGAVPLFRLRADGTGLTPVQAGGTSGSIDVRGRSAVFLNATSSRPNEIFLAEAATGEVRQLTHFTDELLAKLELGKVESYWFTGANNEKIHGWLIYPPGYDAKKPYPLVQLMHGGPHTMNQDNWSYRWNSHVFAAAGYMVTWVDRHGSTGFGEKFAMSILNQWGDMPFEDIMKSTDYLLKRFPNIDPQRLAAAGGSYGGYMAAWVLGHTDRFKAIIDHAGVNDSYAQYATDVPHGFTQVMGGTPWGDVAGMQKENPMFYAKNFKTPTLILHGEMDYRVPYGNGLVLYGVLQSMGVPTRLVIFPNENHWVLSPQNAIYWHWEMQSWLARYIGGKPSLEKPAFDAPEAK